MSGAEEVLTTTLGDVINGREAITRLSQQAVGLKAAQQILKLQKHLDEIGTDFAKRRDAVAAEMGTPAGEGKWKLEKDKLDEFAAAVSKIMKEEVTIPVSVCISLAILEDSRISAADLHAITFLVADLE